MTVDELIKKLARERKLSDEMIDIIKRSFQEGVDYAFIKYKLFLFYKTISPDQLTEDDIRDMSIIAVDKLQEQGLIVDDNNFDFQDTVTESINTVLTRKIRSELKDGL